MIYFDAMVVEFGYVVVENSEMLLNSRDWLKSNPFLLKIILVK